MILDNICDKRKEQLERDISKVSRQDIKYMAAEKEYQTVSFSKSIKHDTLSVISEVKKASPSKGLICPDFDPVKTACEYEKSGANAISCLTEEHYFQGSGEYLKATRAAVKLPILRKDFIIDEYQLYQARVMGADAVLLIAACLTPDQCLELAELAHTLQLETLLEIHSEAELEYLNPHIDMLGVNNRNLGTFHTDVANSFRLAEKMQEIVKEKDLAPLLVSESGISSTETVSQLREAGFRGFLIGETFMKTGQPGDTLSAFIGGLPC